MAIPFVVPSDENNHSEADLEQLLCDLIDINQQIQILLRARMQNRTSSYVSSRVCTSPRHSTRNQTVAAESASTMPDLVSNLPLSSSAPATHSRRDIALMPADGQTIRTRRQRTSSESSTCCDHAKYTVYMGALHDTISSSIELSADEEVDWSQVGVIVRQVADDFKPAASKSDQSMLSQQSSASSSYDGGVKHETKSLLSKLIPTTTSSCSLWTAVICVVGWRLFCAR